MTADKLTDERIIDIATKTRSADPGRDGYILPILFARAIESEVRALLAGAAEGWIDPHDQLPELGTDCFVWHREVVLGFGPYATVDRWDEQREAPVSFSSATIPIGPGWDNAEFDDVLFWKPVIALGAAAPLAATPAQAVEELTNSLHQIAPSGEGFAASEDSARPVAGSAPTEQEPPL